MLLTERKEDVKVDLKLKDKLILVTGSTSGIGKAVAKELLAEGARVIINEPIADNVKKAADELSALGSVLIAPGDLSTMEGAQKVIGMVDSYGELDVLVNNAGVYWAVPFEQCSDEDWMRMFNINMFSMVRLCRYFLPKMLKRNSGKILCSASEAAVKPLPTFLHYCASKAAIMSLARGMAELTKGTKVTVNCILPGPTWTEGTAEYQTGIAKSKGMTIEQHVEDYFNNFDPTSLVRRWVDPREIATTVVYYCSELSSATNGAPIRIEGGIIRSI